MSVDARPDRAPRASAQVLRSPGRAGRCNDAISTCAHKGVGVRCSARDRTETIADGVVHVVGVLFGTVAVVPLVVLATRTAGTSELVSIVVYGVALLTSLVVSAAYNLWPISPLKRILRRIDHSAIYLLIAGTYTPFISQLKGGLEPLFWLAGIWGTSLLGIVLKLRFPGRFDRSSVVLYILIGWSGVMAYDDLVAALPVSTLWLLGIGGVVYTVGVLFHVWESLPFQRAIWHVFVLTAALCHYGAVLDCMVLARVS